MKMNKKLIVLLGVAALAAGVFILRPTESTTTIADSQECAIKIGYSRLRISLPIFVANEQGIFKKNGLNVCLEMYDTAQPLMQALVEGEVEVGGYTALPITFNAMNRSGKSLYFISTMVEDQNHRISYLLKKKGSEINDIADLEGKRIGILPTIAYSAWIKEILKSNNIDPESVIIQQVAPNLQPSILESGGVDILFTNDPAATSILALGIAEPLTDEVEVPKALGEPFPFGSFNVSTEWADANPVLFLKLVASINEAVSLVNNNPKLAKISMQPYLPDAFKPHVELYPDALYLNTDQSTEEMYINIAQSYYDMGITENVVSLTGLIVTSE